MEAAASKYKCPQEAEGEKGGYLKKRVDGILIQVCKCQFKQPHAGVGACTGSGKGGSHGAVLRIDSTKHVQICTQLETMTPFLHLLWMVSRCAGEGTRGVRDECPPAIHTPALVQYKTAQSLHGEFVVYRIRSFVPQGLLRIEYGKGRRQQ